MTVDAVKRRGWRWARRILPPAARAALARAFPGLTTAWRRTANLAELRRRGFDGVQLSDELVSVVKSYAQSSEDMMDEGELADIIRALTYSDPQGSEVILELGTFQGNTASLMGDVLNRLDSSSLVVSIDAFDLVAPDPINPRGSLECWLEKNSKWQNVTVLIRGFTEEVAKFIRPGCACLLIVDAYHEYDSVYQDIASYLPAVRNDGVIFVDDYNELRYPGVWRATNELLVTNKSVETLKMTSHYAIFGKK